MSASIKPSSLGNYIRAFGSPSFPEVYSETDCTMINLQDDIYLLEEGYQVLNRVYINLKSFPTILTLSSADSSSANPYMTPITTTRVQNR